jgi:hypothetical protein
LFTITYYPSLLIIRSLKLVGLLFLFSKIPEMDDD